MKKKKKLQTLMAYLHAHWGGSDIKCVCCSAWLSTHLVVFSSGPYFTTPGLFSSALHYLILLNYSLLILPLRFSKSLSLFYPSGMLGIVFVFPQQRPGGWYATTLGHKKGALCLRPVFLALGKLRTGVQGHLKTKVHKAPFKPIAGHGGQPLSSHVEKPEIERLWSRPGQKWYPISKITRVKRAKGMAHAVKHLPSKC
jgi:hypothetical protein